jgi:hypothetical protein
LICNRFLIEGQESKRVVVLLSYAMIELAAHLLLLIGLVAINLTELFNEESRL